jgi:phosphoribosylformylglycinamidine synthase subunit PurQ / glutaminase
MKCKVIVFPGSNCDHDCYSVLKDVLRHDVEYVWHKTTTIDECDLIILPGGFSYGDYLRTGAIARFSPIMKEVVRHAHQGRPVIGICNGFQILLEVGLLPGAMLRNKTLQFVCKPCFVRVENAQTLFTNKTKKNDILQIPIAHGEGNYFCSPDVLKSLQNEDRIVFRYCSESGTVNQTTNPNGSLDNIAGIMNEKGTILGMMPHPERSSEDILGSHDGLAIWQSILNQCS